MAPLMHDEAGKVVGRWEGGQVGWSEGYFWHHSNSNHFTISYIWYRETCQRQRGEAVKFVKECEVENGFLTGRSYTGDFQLSRPYFKITEGADEAAFYGCLPYNQKNELDIYALDECFREIDSFTVRQEGIGCLTDIWVDCTSRMLFLIYEGSVGRYNLNGDYLGQFMKAPGSTRYMAMTTCSERIYLGYKRGSCSYVGEYGCDGCYYEKINLGNNCQITGIEVTVIPNGTEISVFVKKRSGISTCLIFHTFLMPVKEEICRRQNSICYY